MNIIKYYILNINNIIKANQKNYISDINAELFFGLFLEPGIVECYAVG